MKKFILITIIVIALVIIWQVGNFTLFPVERINLSRHPVKGKNFSLDVTYVSTGATTDNVIQIRKLYDDGRVEIVKNIEEYNNFLGASLVGDSLLKLVVSDTGYYKRGPDTIMVKI
ncbi:hypothetical protein [Chitinophaga sancti]|uniref:Uncharacterized protein n=1 Tax=Chitinophaga sancti TaxID=1004 RepID=A0A1K1SFF4_9BACT|nr:hypothetical protein [Chitinophaga sancti]WQD59799.1 hypothetical protein U0033_18075 [Chitinophaga sancti]WQG88070.1 hypothetical protein SR876_24390 [Chitinophaga sancti]SFW82994.1 hypothetical protein SAMN05661012_05321 [Chitinophaga sancti]